MGIFSWLDTSPKIQVVSSGGRQGHVNCESRIYQYRLKSKLPWIRRELANDQYKLVQHVAKNWIGAKYDIER